MWESRAVCEIPKGLWELVESPLLAFHSFHQSRHFHSSLAVLLQFPFLQLLTAVCR